MKKAIATLSLLAVSSSMAFGQEASDAASAGLDLSMLLPMFGTTGQTMVIVFGSIAALNTISIGLEKIAKLTPTDKDDRAIGVVQKVLGGAQKVVNMFIAKR